LRGVWLTTAFGLDWPGGIRGAAAQERALRSIIRNAAARQINTIFFQVVTRGDAFYASERLPWSPVLTGAAGVDPGFDPLAVAVEEAHTNGLELHAWVNVYRIRAMTTPGGGPDHVTESHPEWTELGGEWLNPGYPGVNDWLVENVTEIVTNYDVDGIHFDFARYNQSGYLRDDSLFAVNNPDGIALKNDWRRENVNRFVRQAFSEITSEKPWIKVGSTPIGNYDQTCINTSFTGYAGVFQDSRRWLQEGYNDYLVPQIYWPDNDASRPNLYSCLVDDWVSKKGTSRHVYIGIGLYQDAVQREIGDQIDISRSEGANGVAFFREEHTRSEDFANRLELPSLRPPASLRFESAEPSRPEGLSATVDAGSRAVTLSWLASSGSSSDPVGWYLILRSSTGAPDLTNPAHHRAIVFADRLSFVDRLEDSDTGTLYYALAAIGRLGIESEVSETVATGEIPTGVEEAGPVARAIGVPYPNPASNFITVPIVSTAQFELAAKVIDQTGRVVWYDRRVRPGNRLEIPVDQLANGVYALEIAAAGGRQVRVFVVLR
jgi:uncharacterized lipoprotein YddW (UPF0748 family)